MADPETHLEKRVASSRPVRSKKSHATAGGILETFANPYPQRDYTVRMRCPEFTCLCPKTGQPDFATVHVEYVPDQTCVELKSLKLYLWSFRDQGAFHEAVTGQILDDLVAVTAPRFMRVTAEFLVRGGIYTTVVAEHRQPGWAPAAPVSLP
jgi:7-cyano-7-deazaguanine reductase